MPGSKPKELYLAKSINELNKLAEFKLHTDKIKMLYSAADKVYSKGEEYFLLGDEEKAYVQFMRYFELVQQIKKAPEYHLNRRLWDDLLGSKKSAKAIEKAEQLNKSLERRYELKMEEEEVRKKLEHLDRLELEREKNDLKMEEVDNEVIVNGKEDALKDGVVSPQQLYSLIKDIDTSVVIMDARMSSDFQHSHLLDKLCINIPAEIIHPGIIVINLEKGIPNESLEVWRMRGRVDYVVLMDWHSSIQDLVIGSKLLALKEALVKWDSSSILRSGPLILQGGYENWLMHYPILTTNSKVIVPIRAEMPILSQVSMDFDYPNFDETFRDPPALPIPANVKGEISSQSDTSISLSNNTNSNKKSIPRIDRSSKPKGSVEATKSDQSLAQLTGESFIINDNLLRIGNTKESRTQVQRDFTQGLAREEHLAQERISLQQEQLDKEQEFEKLRLRKEKEIEESKLLEVQKREEMLCERLQRLQEEQFIKDKAASQLRSENELMRQQLDDHMNRESRRAFEEEIVVIKRKEEERKHLEEQVNRLRKIRKKHEADEKKKQELDGKAHLQKQKHNKELEERQRLEEEKLKKQKTEEEMEERDEVVQPPITISSYHELDSLHSSSSTKKTSNDSYSATSSNERDAPSSSALAKHGFRTQLPIHRVSLGSSGLPPGWEKVLDPQTGRYYYINLFTNQQQWQAPPVLSMQLSQEKEESSTSYTEKLKEKEPTAAKKSGLTRSHSSPNIAQMVNLEGEKNLRPQINRLNKPTENVEIPSVDRNVKPQAQEISAARLRNLMPVFGSQGRALTGLRNLGNTCFMSSIIQCLCNTTPLSEYFGNDTYCHHVNRENKLGHSGEVAEEFAVIVRAVWSAQYRSIAPRDFKNTVSKYAPMFSGYEQQDSQEFLLFLMDGLHEDLNRVKNRPLVPEQENNKVADNIAAERAWKLHKVLNESIIVELFQGQFKSTLRCLKCGKTSVTFDAFMYLSLPITANANRCSLTDCIRLFLKEETMTGGSKWYCPRCKEHREAVKKFDIWKLPPILLIHLKRFSYEGLWRRKLQTSVDFPLTALNLQPHIIGPSSKCLYNLYAVSNHYGTMEGGHYTAYCKNAVYQKWIKFDDHEVFEMNTNDVRSSAAYILFYTYLDFKPPVMHGF